VESVLPTSAGVGYDGPADWRGSSFSRYVADWYEINGSNNPVIWTDVNSNGYTNPGGGAGPALKPGTTYHVYIRAEGSGGVGPSASIALETLAGGRTFNGSSFRNTKVRVWNGSSFQLCRVRTWNGSSWQTIR
jgi:hypothetical protein